MSKRFQLTDKLRSVPYLFEEGGTFEARDVGTVPQELIPHTADELTTRRANDILRSSGLTPAPLDDPGVMKDLVKVIEGTALSPILMLKGKRNAEIADGFHRVSLVYQLDPYADIPLKLV